MKKKLEADLISIAHRILQIKNKSDINQLFLETQKLYEKLSVLRFVEEHFGEAKPTIGQAEVVEKMKEFFENIAVPEFQMPISNPIAEETPIQEEIIESETIDFVEIEDNKENTIEVRSEESIQSGETLATENQSEPVVVDEEPEVFVAEIIEETKPAEEPATIPEKLSFAPIVEAIEAVQPEIPAKKEAVQISFDDILGGNYSYPQFVKVSSSEKKQESETTNEVSSFEFQKETTTTNSAITFEKEEPKNLSLNDKLTKEIIIGLNDRIAFVNKLFGGSNEDYNRVLSQLITFDTFQETKSFIDEMVKPDYNNWKGMEEYEQRFIEIIEKKFLSF